MATPLHRTIAAELRHRVRSGKLQVGESLPSESQLCEEFSASRGPVRQALATLRDEGLIGGGQGKRTVVLDTVPTQPFESFLSFTHRAELTGHTPGQKLQGDRPAAPRTGDRRRPGDQRGRPRGPAHQAAPARRTPRDAGAHDVRRVGGAPVDLRRSGHGSIYALLTEQGVDLHSARHTFDAVPANSLDAELLDVPEGFPLLRERRLTTDSHGTPVEWSEDRYRSDTATVTVTNTRSSRSAML